MKTVQLKDGTTLEALSIRELRARLDQIIEENEKAGTPHRLDYPIIIKLPQGNTPTGRRRDDKWAPLHIPVNGGMSFDGCDFMVIRAGEVLDR